MSARGDARRAKRAARRASRGGSTVGNILRAVTSSPVKTITKVVTSKPSSSSSSSSLGKILITSTEASKGVSGTVISPTKSGGGVGGSSDTLKSSLEKFESSSSIGSKHTGVTIPVMDKFGRSQAWYEQQALERNLSNFAANEKRLLQIEVDARRISANKAN